MMLLACDYKRGNLCDAELSPGSAALIKIQLPGNGLTRLLMYQGCPFCARKEVTFHPQGSQKTLVVINILSSHSFLPSIPHP